MGRRREDPRPPIELIGAAPSEDLQRVEVGRRGGVPKTGLAIAVVLGVVLVAGLALGGGDGGTDDGGAAAGAGDEALGDQSGGGGRAERSTSTTRHRQTTTTTVAPVTTIPGSGVTILLSGTPRGAQLLDLDTGAVEAVDLRRDLELVPVAGGVVSGNGSVAQYHPLPVGEPVELGPATQVLPADDRHVWLVQSSDEGSFTLRRVDVSGEASFGPPLSLAGGWVAGSTRDGVLVQAGGRVYELQGDGSVQPVATGELLGSSAGWAVIRSCDDRLRCRIDLWEPGLRSHRPIPALDGRSGGYGIRLEVRPDGRRAAGLRYGPGSPELVWLNLETGEVTAVREATFVSALAWLPGDLGLVTVNQGAVLRVHENPRGNLQVDRLRDEGADLVAVIPP